MCQSDTWNAFQRLYITFAPTASADQADTHFLFFSPNKRQVWKWKNESTILSSIIPVLLDDRRRKLPCNHDHIIWFSLVDNLWSINWNVKPRRKQLLFELIVVDNVVEYRIVQTKVIHQRCGFGRSAICSNCLTFSLEAAQQQHQFFTALPYL